MHHIERQWMVPHEWMIKYTPQTEWILRRGMLVWIAEVFTSLGAGLFLVSLFFDNWWGMLGGWVIIMFLKIPLHVLYFGKPLRFWRTLPPFTPGFKTSWFTRGIVFSVLFTGVVFVQLVVSYIAINHILPGAAWGTWDIVLRAIGGILAFLVGIYSGFIMSFCRSVPFWNTAMVPLILLFAGVADGFALMLGVGLADSSVNLAAVEMGSRIMLVINIIFIIAFLWNATYASKTAKYTASLWLKGSLALPFWLGVVLCGLIVPLAISVASLYTEAAAAPSLLITAIVLHTIGAVALKYVLLRGGVHNPILPATTSSYH